MSKVVLWVSDLQAQIEFYSKLFDVKAGFIGDDFAEVSCELNSVLLHTLPEEFRAEAPLEAQPRHQTEVAIKPVFTVSNLSEAHRRVADTFASFSPGTIDFGQFVYQDVVDPEGNVIQLQQRVGN